MMVILEQLQLQQTGDTLSIAQLLTGGGGLGALAFIVIAFMKGWIKKGGPCERCADRDRWIEAYMKKADALEGSDKLQEANIEALRMTNDLLTRIDQRPTRRT